MSPFNLVNHYIFIFVQVFGVDIHPGMYLLSLIAYDIPFKICTIFFFKFIVGVSSNISSKWGVL